MQIPRLAGRVAAVCAAVTLTICGAWLASVHSGRTAMQVTGTAGQRQVIILDAGHDGSC